MIHIFDSEHGPKFFCADDVSEHLADLLKGYEHALTEPPEDYSIDWQPPGTEYSSQFVMTRKARSDGERDTRFRIAIARVDGA